MNQKHQKQKQHTRHRRHVDDGESFFCIYWIRRHQMKIHRRIFRLMHETQSGTAGHQARPQGDPDRVHQWR